MTKEESMDRIDPALAVAMAKAAGLDASPLEEQIKRREAGDDEAEKLRARVAELEAQVEAADARGKASGVEPIAPQQQFAEHFRDAINRARSPWYSTSELGGDDGEAG
jgi:hypothetical protein